MSEENELLNFKDELVYCKLPSGKEIHLNKNITVNAVSEYEEAIDRGESSKDAFINMLVELNLGESDVSAEDFTFLSEEEFLLVCQRYADDSFIEPYFGQFEDEQDFFERFKKAFGAQRKVFQDRFKSMVPDMSHITKAAESILKLEKLINPLPKAYMDMIKPNVVDMLENPAIKETTPFLDQPFNPSKFDFKHPSTTTNELLHQLIEEQGTQDKENKEIQVAMVETLKNLYQSQVESINENKESSDYTDRQNKLIIRLTIAGLIVALLFGIVSTVATLYPDKLKAIISMIF